MAKHTPPPAAPGSHVALHRKLKQHPVEPESLNIRLHRAISWLKSAEEQEQNIDLAFLSLWISFNACYAVDGESETPLTEKDKFRSFIAKLVSHDDERRIFRILWEKFSQSIRILLDNQYVFKPFWDFHRMEVSGWKGKFGKSIRDANKHLMNGNVPALLEIVLDRLYVLRNQLIHGGATYNSKVNRKSVRDGYRILQMLVPVIIDIMMQNPEEDWGEIYFPVVKE